jgi:hypothetical protein
MLDPACYCGICESAHQSLLSPMNDFFLHLFYLIIVIATGSSAVPIISIIMLGITYDLAGKM